MRDQQNPGRQSYQAPELRSLGTLTQLTQQPDPCQINPIYCDDIPLPGSGPQADL